mgnify:CR=1 FL=1
MPFLHCEYCSIKAFKPKIALSIILYNSPTSILVTAF